MCSAGSVPLCLFCSVPGPPLSSPQTILMLTKSPGHSLWPPGPPNNYDAQLVEIDTDTGKFIPILDMPGFDHLNLGWADAAFNQTGRIYYFPEFYPTPDIYGVDICNKKLLAPISLDISGVMAYCPLCPPQNYLFIRGLEKDEL